MPPAGVFNRPDLYSRRGWRRLQHIAGEFWSHWPKEFLHSLQTWQKWNISKRNFQVGDVVSLKEDTGRSKWPMAQIVSTEPDSQGIVMMMNCFCGMVDRRMAFSLISSRDQGPGPRAGFEPAQNLSSGLVEWSCAVVITTTPRQSVQLKVFDTSNNNIELFQWPISKIVLLVENEHGLIPNEGSHFVWMSSWNTTWGEPDVVVQCRSSVILIYEL